MTGYRVFLLNTEGHIYRVVEIEAEDDASAHAKVRSERDPEHGYELWQASRMVPPPPP